MWNKMEFSAIKCNKINLGVHRIIHKFAPKRKNILINLKTNGMKLILGRLLIALLLAFPLNERNWCVHPNGRTN